MFTKTEARKKLLPYMAENWQELGKVFFENLEREASGKPAKWRMTPSLEAVQAWGRILRRQGID